MRWRRQYYELGSLDSARNVAGCLKRRRESVAAQKSNVFMLPVYRLDDVGLVCPQPYVMAVAGQEIREGSSPRPGSNDAAAHHAALSFFTNLCSSPRRSRPMFAR